MTAPASQRACPSRLDDEFLLALHWRVHRYSLFAHGIVEYVCFSQDRFKTTRAPQCYSVALVLVFAHPNAHTTTLPWNVEDQRSGTIAGQRSIRLLKYFIVGLFSYRAPSASIICDTVQLQ